jgi:hypothetical protein
MTTVITSPQFSKSKTLVKSHSRSVYSLLLDSTWACFLISKSREEDRNKTLSLNVRRIFAERGLDFLDKIRGRGVGIDALHDPDSSSSASGSNEDDDEERIDDSPESSTAHSMTPQQLFKMRSEIYMQLQYDHNLGKLCRND